MEAIPEVRAGLDRLSSMLEEDQNLGAYLDAVATVAQALVPSCVGVSITLVVDGEPYTMTATGPETVEIDVVQNVDGGPCLEAVHEDVQVEVDDVLNEDRWRGFAQAAGARGVRSSLSFPIRDVDGRVSGGVNVYAGDPGAFIGPGRHVVTLLGGELSEAVTNADLSFRTLRYARELPDRLAARDRFDVAVGLMMGRRGWDAEQ